MKIDTKKVLAYKLNEVLCDLRDLKNTNINEVELIHSDSQKGLEVLRHDTAHILAEAIKTTFPKSQITIGPAIENGFYYDIYMPEYQIKEDDLKKIEKEMTKIVKRNQKIYRIIVTSEVAVEVFKKNGEDFKARIIEDLKTKNVSIYLQGKLSEKDENILMNENNQSILDNLFKSIDYNKCFYDLCRGPHSMTTGVEKHFKLQRVSAAYWRGDQNNESLQRIYGTSWATREQLDKHLKFLKKAAEIDHRKLGPQMDLFHMQKEAHGSIFWHPKGWKMFKKIENYIRKKLEPNYQEVNTPQLIDKKLWEMSGHWEHFRDNMFVFESENCSYALKPMNCPAHIQIFNIGTKSYKDLPLRLSEFGSCHRNEPSGSMHGIMRLRNFVQDDAHIFCTEDQIESETKNFCELLKEIYQSFGFKDLVVKFATRPDNSFGSDETWALAEEKLSSGARKAGLDYIVNQGEGAFYGPKLEFVIKDALQRDWQCGTLQLDFFMCKKLNAKYTDSDGKEKNPVMLHRAVLGSLQRFIGILIEHHEGNLPFWLSPVQVVFICLNDNDKLLRYSESILSELKKMSVEAYIDTRRESVSYKLKELIYKKKVPCVVIVGQKEVETNTISFRLGNAEKNMTKNTFYDFIKKQMIIEREKVD